MSGRQFLALWGIALAFTGVVVGWAFAVAAFGLGDAAGIIVGVIPPIAVVMAAMWLVVVRR